MGTPQDQIANQIDAMLPLQGLVAQREPILAIFRKLTADSLSTYPAAVRPRRSTLTE